jgi:acetolactate synthase small subunit
MTTATAIQHTTTQQATCKVSATIYCLVQNRLGALDRVLHAWTHRGIIPQQILSTRDERAGTLQIMVSCDIEDRKALDKLVKCLQKQVYVLDAYAEEDSASFEQVETETVKVPAKVAALFLPAYRKQTARS